MFTPPLLAIEATIDPRYGACCSKNTGWSSSPCELHTRLPGLEQPSSGASFPWRSTEQDNPDNTLTIFPMKEIPHSGDAISFMPDGGETSFNEGV